MIRIAIGEEKRQQLRALAMAAPPGPYQVQTSNSFRRIGTPDGDGNVLSAVTQRSDGHPDLHAASGVLDLFAALDPTTVLELLDEHDRAVAALAYLRQQCMGLLRAVSILEDPTP